MNQTNMASTSRFVGTEDYPELYTELSNGQRILNGAKNWQRKGRKARRRGRTSFPSKLVTKGAYGVRNGRTICAVRPVGQRSPNWYRGGKLIHLGQ